MRNKLLLTIIILGLITPLYSQGSKKSALKVNSFVGVSEYRVGEGEWITLKVGDEIPEDAEIRVNGKNDYLELILQGETTIKLFGLTSIQVKELTREDFSKKKNTTLFLFTGKIFSSIRKAKDQIFKVETETSVAAVRGTKFGLSFIPGEGGELVVSEGVVEVFDPANVFKPVLVKEGNIFRLPSTVGETILDPKPASEDLIKQYDPEYKAPEPKPEATKPEDKPKETKPEGEAPKPSLPGLPGISGNLINFSTGTENINNGAYYKFLITPELTIGDFSFGLYLPFYISANDNSIIGTNEQSLYNKNDWDFSSPQDSWNDLITKIAYLQFKNSFLLFRIGSLYSYTLGSGILVDSYANDLFYPSERNIGIIFGLDGGMGGFEFFTGDAGNFELIGGKVFARPLNNIPIAGQWSIGISTFVDTKPLTNDNSKVFGYSFDLDMPFIKSDIFGIGLYSGIGTLGYYLDYSKETSYYNGYGFNAGLRGNIVMITYKAEYKHQNGAFSTAYVDKMYDIERANKFTSFVLLSKLNNNDISYNGFVAGTGLELKDIITASISYEHLFPYGTDPFENINNNLHAEVSLDRKFLKKVYGTIAFDWKNFDPREAKDFPPAGSILSAEIFYELIYGIYVGLEWKKFFEKEDGEIKERVLYGLKTKIIF
ncbi:MAG: FecR domain-containing protein [Brevinematales bacterium]|nr:FecR domain-containing protein [Brevinematales bacterium]